MSIRHRNMYFACHYEMRLLVLIVVGGDGVFFPLFWRNVGFSLTFFPWFFSIPLSR
jgi:hypothetical protein